MAILELPRLRPPAAVTMRAPERPDPAGQQRLLKGINRMTLVRQLCATPGLSRADLAASVQLTKSTVGLLVRELIDEGWLLERESLATGDVGRRPTPLFIDPTRLVLLGAEIGIESARLVATSLTGDILAGAQVEHGSDRSAEGCVRRLAAAMAAMRSQLSARQEVIGIGIGLPGGVDESTGFLHFAPNLGWRDVALGGMLQAALAGSRLAGAPLFLQNEADVAALGELEFDSGATASDPLLYVSINHGVGAGVIVGDRLLIGSRGFAGEIGHTILQADGPPCSCGRRGCAEALIGVRAMLPTTGRPGGRRPAAPLARIARLLAAGDADTQRAVGTAGHFLGMLLQNLASAYDPGCMVLGGAVVELGDAFIAPALRTLRAYCEAASLPVPAVRLSRRGADAVAVGAAALVRYRLTRPLIATGASKAIA